MMQEKHITLYYGWKIFTSFRGAQKAWKEGKNLFLHEKKNEKRRNKMKRKLIIKFYPFKCITTIDFINDEQERKREKEKSRINLSN